MHRAPVADSGTAARDLAQSFRACCYWNRTSTASAKALTSGPTRSSEPTPVPAAGGRACRARASPSGHRTPPRSRSSATSAAGTAIAIRSSPRPDSPGIWQGVVAGVEPRDALQVPRRLPAGGLCGRQGRPVRVLHRGQPPRAFSVVWDPRLSSGRTANGCGAARAPARSARPGRSAELHPGSWRRVPEQHDRFLNYRELAHALGDYVTEARLHPH